MNYETVKEVFEKAIGIPREEREQFVIEYVKGDSELLKEVQSLLACSHPADATDFSYEPMVGKKVGEYIVTKRIGSGGMGRVYEAKNEQLGKSVAIKVLRKQFLGSSAGKRFEQEVRVLRTIKHSGVAKIESAGTIEIEGSKLPWIAMELFEGSQSITEFAEGESLEVKLQLLREVCTAVEEAHRHGVIHRDLKPTNILVDPSGHPKIIDFGIAKVLDEELRATGLHTQASGFIGTPQYMAPEQFGSSISETTATDIFSLGVIMFEVLTGEHPFAGTDKSIPEIMLSITSGEPTPIESINAALRGSVSVVVHKTLAKNPRMRYASANELALDLQHIIDGEPVAAKPEPVFSRIVRKHRFVAALLAITIPLLAIATTVSVNYAINANRQLVRNEKLLEFATGVMQIDRSIVQQHPDYWGKHTDAARLTAEKLTKLNPILRIEMYEMLGTQDRDSSVGKSRATAYKKAVSVSRKTYGPNAPQTLILELKALNASRELSNIDKIEESASILSRWKSGSPSEKSEIFRLVSSIELDSTNKETLALGHLHAKEAERIAREELNENYDAIIKSVIPRAWSLLFKDGSSSAITQAIRLEQEIILPLLAISHSQTHTKVLQQKTLLALAFHQRSLLVTKEARLDDINRAIQMNEFIVESLIEETRVGHNSVWQVMNNLALSLVAKSEYLYETEQSENEQIEKLQQQASELWIRILQQSQFKKNDDYDVHSWYLLTFQRALPEYAPTNEQWNDWVNIISDPPTNK